MSNKYSANATQLKGLNRLGDVMIPGGGGLPSFSQSGSAAHLDRMLPYMYPGDREPLKGLLFACAYLPTPIITALVAMVSSHAKVPEPLAGVFRLANLGIKGVVHSLYYSDLTGDNEAGSAAAGSAAAGSAATGSAATGSAGGAGGGSIHAVMGYNPVMNVAAYEQHLKQQAGLAD